MSSRLAAAVACLSILAPALAPALAHADPVVPPPAAPPSAVAPAAPRPAVAPAAPPPAVAPAAPPPAVAPAAPPPTSAPAAPPSAVAPAAPVRPAPLAAVLVRPLPPRKDPGVALGLSLGITAGGMALMAIGGGLDSELGSGLATVGALGALVGPTTGHAYAGRIGNPGLAVRAASALAGTVAIGGIIGCIGDNLEGHPDTGDDDCGGWALLLVVSSLTYVGGAVHEIADAPRAARRYNARHGLEVQVAPTVVGGDGDRAPGLVLAGHF